jgi:hypothetical protein
VGLVSTFIVERGYFYQGRRIDDGPGFRRRRQNELCAAQLENLSHSLKAILGLLLQTALDDSVEGISNAVPDSRK